MRTSSRSVVLASSSITILGLVLCLTGCDLVARLKGSADAGSDAAVVVDAAPVAIETAAPVVDAAAPIPTHHAVAVHKTDGGAGDAGVAKSDAGTAPVVDAGIPTPLPAIPIPTSIPGIDAGAWKPFGKPMLPR